MYKKKNNSNLILKLNNVFKSYNYSIFRRFLKGHEFVLENINLNIYKSECIGLIGTNGAGKSTLLKIIGKVIKQTSGNVFGNPKISSLLNLSISINPDQDLTQNIHNFYLMNENYIENKNRFISKVKKFSGLVEDKKKIKFFSDGMRARLALSLFINLDAELYLIDEALSVGDVEFNSNVSKKLKELIKVGKSIIIVSHNLSQVRQFCSRTIWINNKTIKEDGVTNNVINNYMSHNVKQDKFIKNSFEVIKSKFIENNLILDIKLSNTNKLYKNVFIKFYNKIHNKLIYKKELSQKDFYGPKLFKLKLKSRELGEGNFEVILEFTLDEITQERKIEVILPKTPNIHYNSIFYYETKWKINK